MGYPSAFVYSHVCYKKMDFLELTASRSVDQRSLLALLTWLNNGFKKEANGKKNLSVAFQMLDLNCSSVSVLKSNMRM